MESYLPEFIGIVSTEPNSWIVGFPDSSFLPPLDFQAKLST